jgi:steroid delta-isomerase-like uncharacterized protein
MSGESLIVAARAYVEAFNSADWDRFETALTPDSVYDEVGTGRRAEGREAILELFQGWKHTMPDAVGTVSSALASGNEVVLEVTWKGTMTGPWGDTPATGKQQKNRAALFLSFSGEAISESRQYFDSLALLQELGVMPEPAVV